MIKCPVWKRLLKFHSESSAYEVSSHMLNFFLSFSIIFMVMDIYSLFVMLRWEFPLLEQILYFHLMSPRMKTSFGVLPRDCRMIVVWEPRGRPPDVSRRPNQTTPEAVRDNQPSNNLSPSGTVRLLGWSWAKTRTTLQFFSLFMERMQVSICFHGWLDYLVCYDACGESRWFFIGHFIVHSAHFFLIRLVHC